MPGINQLGGAQAVNIQTPQPSSNEASTASRVRVQAAVQPSSADAVKGAEQMKAASREASDGTSEVVRRKARQFSKLRAQSKRIETDQVNLARGKPTGSVDNAEVEAILAKNRRTSAKMVAKNRAKTNMQERRIASATKGAVRQTPKEVVQLQRAMKDLFAPRPSARKA